MCASGKHIGPFSRHFHKSQILSCPAGASESTFFVTFHFLPVSAGTCGASFSQYTTNTGCPKSHFTLPFYCFVSVIIWTDMKRSAFASLNLKVLVSISFPCQLTLEQRCKKFLYLWLKFSTSMAVSLFRRTVQFTLSIASFSKQHLFFA